MRDQSPHRPKSYPQYADKGKEDEEAVYNKTYEP